MGLFDRLSGVVRSNLSEVIEKVEDPEMVLDQLIANIQNALIETKVAIARVESIPNQKAKLNYDVAMAEVSKWQENLWKAKRANNERLTFYALERLRNHQVSARIAESKLDKNTGQAIELRQNLVILEKKLSEAKARKDILKSRAAAKANEQLQSTISGLNTSGAMSTFELREEKVLMMKNKSQAAGELTGSDLKSQFAMLESGSDVDEELAAMEAQLTDGDELDALQKQIDSL